MFKQLTDYSTNYDGASKAVKALRVMKNLVPISGYDNDRISVSGTIEVGGSQIAFDGISTDVVIQKSTGSAFDLIIADGMLTQDDRSVVLTAQLWNEGSEVTDLSGYTFEWKIIDPDGTDKAFSNVSTTKTQTVVAADVNYQARVRCTVKKGTDVVATGFCTVTDYSDPVQASFNITGIDGTTVKSGQTLGDISDRHLGPGRECYVETYNGLGGDVRLKAGQKLKIPKLRLKKRRPH